jgi:4-oxalocrotonate tautomerase
VPEVHVYMTEGRTQDQKVGMMRSITDALVDNLGCPRDVVTVQIIEAPWSDKMKGGHTFDELIRAGKHSLSEQQAPAAGG